MKFWPDQVDETYDPSPWVHEMSPLRVGIDPATGQMLYLHSDGKIRPLGQTSDHNPHVQHVHVQMQSNARQAFKQTYVDAFNKITKAFTKAFKQSDYVLFPPPLEESLRPMPRAHSMTPRKNTVYDRRGRKRY